MLEFTKKEWICFSEYVKDLIEELNSNDDYSICDRRAKYSMRELLTLQKKIVKTLKTLE
ncbi:MAG: hypothetical protein PHC92_08625 [Syntrophomonadaceae bacterium]|nr:hypothetical protein [Syntrophomonadaceae bacterium]